MYIACKAGKRMYLCVAWVCISTQELYPANDQLKLHELVDTCQLMGSVLEFQQQAMGILTTGKLSDMIIESMKVSEI